MQLLTAVIVLEREKLSCCVFGLRIRIFWTIFSHMQGVTFTNSHLKLPFPVSLSSFLPAQRLVCTISSVP